MSNMKKRYSINGVDFLLKESFTAEERIELNYLTRSAQVIENEIIEVNLTREEASRFLELVLVTDQKVPKDFYNLVTVEQTVEVLGDFMKDRALRGE